MQRVSQLTALTQLRELELSTYGCPQQLLDACAQLTGEVGCCFAVGWGIVQLLQCHMHLPCCLEAG